MVTRVQWRGTHRGDRERNNMVLGDTGMAEVEKDKDGTGEPRLDSFSGRRHTTEDVKAMPLVLALLLKEVRSGEPTWQGRAGLGEDDWDDGALRHPGWWQLGHRRQQVRGTEREVDWGFYSLGMRVGLGHRAEVVLANKQA